MKDINAKLDLITEKDQKIKIPYVIYEKSEIRHEKRERKLLGIICFLIFVILITNI